jgi:hypothetical protein
MSLPHTARGPEWQRLVALSKGAVERGRLTIDRMRPRPKPKPWCPSGREWMVLFELAEGPRLNGELTVPGATVNRCSVTALERRGLVTRKGPWCHLTDEGRERVERRW